MTNIPGSQDMLVPVAPRQVVALTDVPIQDQLATEPVTAVTTDPNIE